MACCAEITRTRSPHAVLAQPVPVMNQVARRKRVLCLEIDVTAVAVAHGPLVFVLVATEAGRHLGTKSLRFLQTNLGMTVNAITLRGGHVNRMLESQVLAGHFGSDSAEVFAVAPAASARVVRLGVTPEAVLRRGKVRSTLLFCTRDPGVADDAVDPLADVNAMLERMRWRTPDSEDTSAGGERQTQDE